MAQEAEIVERYRAMPNMAAIGRELGLSRERVRQILVRAGIETTRSAREAAPKETHGGLRPGSGRKPVEGERRHVQPVTLTTRDTDYLQTVGDGNISEGVRRLIAWHRNR